MRLPSTSASVSTGSRVVPACSLTITRSEPSRALSSDDLPTFGRPRIAMRGGCFLIVLDHFALRGARSSLDQAVEQVAGTESMGGGHRQGLSQAEAR